jgi:hypothetical protein
MCCLYRLFLFALLVLSVSNGAYARLPEPGNPSERSLLYWRYLCQDEEQAETVQNGQREFKCISRGWTVKTSENNGTVQEIIDDAP